ncbi:MAG TPA: nitroreductase family protein [Anaeromyxobacteraceae bacterium]|nr:nitroreductase family protein [Anaeromyxobacteraceae bacterium]
MGGRGGDRLALPPPRLGAAGLAWALARRRSRREFGRRDVAAEALAGLCWSAQGRTASWGGRTAPSAGGLFYLLLAAEALGLAAVPVAAFDDQAVLAALGLDPAVLPLYLVPVGEAV